MIFSDIDGLYDSDPRLHPEARLLSRIECIDDGAYAMAGGRRLAARPERDEDEIAGGPAGDGAGDRYYHHQRGVSGGALVAGRAAGTLFAGRK